MTQHIVLVLSAVVAVQTVIIVFLLFSRSSGPTQAKSDNRMIDVGRAISIHQDQQKVR